MTFDLILIGLAITLEPIPLTSFILVLASNGGVRKGAGFIFGWLLSLAVVVSLTLVATGNKPPKPNTAPSLAALAVKILIGVTLVLIAVRQWRRMGRPKRAKKTPRWQTGIDNMSPWFAVGLALLVQPWGLVAAGVAVITEAKLSTWQSYVALILFCVISVITYVLMELYAGFRPEKAQAFLARTRAWVDTHTDQVIIVVSLVLGFWLIGKSTYLIVT
ncbi:MAG TPA: GAP family protein [Acidimicrobiales bacterium]|nr:GAP family protein [Acidimicrobiales bacterium]